MCILGLKGSKHLKCPWVKYRRFGKDYKQIIHKLLSNKYKKKATIFKELQSIIQKWIFNLTAD